jgi:branched-chain amino acid transport system permease protein
LRFGENAGDQCMLARRVAFSHPQEDMSSEELGMSASGLLAQLLNGLASASSLFLVSVGLSLIFGVTRTINFAHGSFFMLGAFMAYSSVERLAPHIGFWPALLLAPLACGLLGALTEMLLLRRIYKAPELFQLLATFALVLVIKDAALWLWGPEELFGPRAAGLKARWKSWAASSPPTTCC